ncbi:DUF445 domain-containing protein [Cyclobacterium xiamenense]|uniref:DUF445 domain-containing protein n=1 Tax=Cyclobacterium xiamenense TaxID=1297121 RepID=UPI0013869C55|nr:DUF445 domain-containing protein [Cyclobacterium xiamenense]
MKSNIGTVSLLVAIGGFLSLESGIHFGWLEGPLWRILATGFEAGTIGGLADWFAVSALFYEIPIPFVRRHTNIIVKNREKLTEGIVELVTTKWLSPQVLRERLQGLSIADSLLRSLDEPAQVQRLMDFMRWLLLRVSGELDHPKLAIFIQKISNNQLREADIASPLGAWLEDAVREKRHHGLVQMALGQFSLSLQESETRELLLKKLSSALKQYAQRDWVKKSAVWLGQKTGGIDPELLTDRLIDLALVLMEEIRNDPDHPLREKLDEYLLELAANLKNGEQQTLSYLERLKQNLLLNDRSRVLIQQLLDRLKAGFQDQLTDNDRPLMHVIHRQLLRFLEELRNDPTSRGQFDRWIGSTVMSLVDRYHHELGAMVRSSLGRLDDKGIMLQIKDKVGNDLQYIRLNGAVVGGLVGIGIALIRWLLL